MVETDALLLKSVPFADADLILTLFTEQLGKVAAIARGARRPSKRVGGALEPLHTMGLRLEIGANRELLTIQEATIRQMRTGLSLDLDAMQAAGRGLRWMRQGLATMSPEPLVWRDSGEFLDALNDDGSRWGPRLATFGIRLLRHFGYELALDGCVRCGRPCDASRPAYLCASSGGLVCRACGGAKFLVAPRLRDAMRSSLRNTDDRQRQMEALEPLETETLLEVIDEALRSHSGMVA